MANFTRFLCLSFCAALLAAGCVMTESDQTNLEGVGPDAAPGGDDDDRDDDFDRDDCKIEDGDIGVEGVAIEVGDFSVTFSDWVLKDGETDEYIGFTLNAEDGEVEYTVKTGTETYTDDAATWTHPEGTGGPEVSAISNVDVCDDDGNPPDGGDDGGGGGGDGGGDDGGGDDGGGDDDGSDDGSGGDDDGSDDGGGDDDGDDDGGGDDDGDDDIIVE